MYSINKKKVGVDISDRSIEIAEMTKQGGKVKVSKLGRVLLKEGIVKWGEIKDEEKLRVAFLQVLKEAKPQPIETQSIIIGLPESLVFTYIFSLKSDEKNNLEELIRIEATKNIPLPEKELVYSYKVLNKRKIEIEVDKKIKKTTLTDISLVATSQKHLLMWQKFFQKLGIEIEFFDIETLALFRSIYNNLDNNHVCLIDIGAVTTNISIFSKEGLCYSHFIKKAGDLFTANIAEIRENAQGEKIGLEMAEKIKEEIGLSKTGKYGEELELVLNSILYSISQEIKKTLVYHQVKFRKIISEIILLGGSAKLNGILEYFEKNLVLDNTPAILEEGKEVEGGAKTKEVVVDSPVLARKGLNIRIGQSQYFQGGNVLEYIEAIGIAVRGLEGKSENEPYFEIVDLKKIEKEKIRIAKESEKKILNASSEKSWFKVHKKEAQLLIVLIVGIVMIIGAFWYRSYSAKKMLNKITTTTDNFLYEKIIDYEIPVQVEYGNYNGSFVRGRIFKKTFTEPIEIKTALRESKSEAEVRLKPGEELWKEAISGVDDESKVVFPINFEWLIYTKSDSTGLIMEEIKSIMGEKEFLLSETEFAGIKKGEKANMFLLQVRIKILTKEDYSEEVLATSTIENIKTNKTDAASNTIKTIEITSTKDVMAQEEASMDDLKKLLFKARASEGEGNILIKETETGWLNVRSGPGINFEIVKKVQEGEWYNLIEEQGDWLKIDLRENESGWVLKRYIEKK